MVMFNRFILFLILANTILGQNKLDIEECKRLALINNIKLANSRLELNSAKEDSKKAFNSYFPEITVSGSYFNANEELLLAAVGPMKTKMFDKLMFGGFLLSQPLYAGGRISAGNDLAEINIQVKKLKLRMKRNLVIQKTVELFWQQIAIQEKYKTINEYENLVYKLYEKVNDGFNVGLATKKDLMKVKIALSEVKISKIKLENANKLSQMALCQHIGLPIGQEYIFNDELEIIKTPEEIYVKPEKSAYNRLEMKLLEKSIEFEEINTELVRGEYLPSVGINLNGFYLDALDNNGEFHTSLIGSISIPISNWWGGTYALHKRSLEEKIARNNKKDSRELMILQINSSWNDLIEKSKLVNLAIEIMEQTKENLRISEDSFKEGLIDISDLLEAKTKYFEANNRFIESKINYKIQIMVYLKSIGVDL